jgi:hypothetical protein
MIPKYLKQFILKLTSTERDISSRHFKKKVFCQNFDTSWGQTFGNNKIMIKCTMIHTTNLVILKLHNTEKFKVRFCHIKNIESIDAYLDEEVFF